MRKCLSVFVLIFLSYFTFGFDSPAPGGKILSFFAQDSSGRFNTGHEIQSRDVYASEDGEIVFYNSQMIAVKHNDEIMSIYKNVNVRESSLHRNFVKRGQIIGSAVGGSFHFDIFDTAMNRYINPSLMIERTKKSELPAVSEIGYDKSGILEIKLDDSETDSLYSIQILLDGRQIYDLKFETISVSDDSLKLDDTGFTYADLYRKSGVFSIPGIPFKKGENSLEIIVKDFYGKTISFRDIISL